MYKRKLLNEDVFFIKNFFVRTFFLSLFTQIEINDQPLKVAPASSGIFSKVKLR